MSKQDVLNKKVIVGWGRNRGEVGTVTCVDRGYVYIDFHRTVEVNEGFGSTGNYPDAYWAPQDCVAVVSNL